VQLAIDGAIDETSAKSLRSCTPALNTTCRRLFQPTSSSPALRLLSDSPAESLPIAMALIDRVPGDLNLYIGGYVMMQTTVSNSPPTPAGESTHPRLTVRCSMFTLRRREALEQADITHVVSVLRLPLDQNLFSPFKKHMVVEVDDVEDENLLEHFPATNQFIKEGLEGGGGVLVHW
jgi:hypothetical protein